MVKIDLSILIGSIALSRDEFIYRQNIDMRRTFLKCQLSGISC